MQTRRMAVFGGAILLVVMAIAQEAKPPAAPAPAPATTQPSPAKVGQGAPDFTLLDSAGKKHGLAELKDKIVVLEWLNQDCPWSAKGMPVCNELASKYAPQGVVWLGIESTHFRTPEQNETYIKDNKLPYPILMDTDGKIGRLYGAKTTPHVFIIEKGKLVYAGGLHNDQAGSKPKAEFRNYVDEGLAALLAGKAVPVAETTSWGCPVKYKESKAAGAAAPKAP
jgi:peroxiredoxin